MEGGQIARSAGPAFGIAEFSDHVRETHVAHSTALHATLDGRPIAIAHPENDHITEPQVLADWLQSIGGGELAVIHGADHYLRDRADEVSDYLGDFLRRSLTTSDN
jgi:alpha/beta superfamily hydrolase